MLDSYYFIMVEKVLKDLGLSDKEIKVYMALLPLGNAPSSILGKRTGIQRSTAKYTCQQLQKKGFISALEKNNTFIYSIEPPEKIVQKIELERELLEEHKTSLNRIVPELKSMINPNVDIPRVKFFEGKEGYIRFCEESLLCQDKTIYFATNMDEFRNIVTPKYDKEKFIPNRIKNDIHLKLLTVRSETTEKMKNNDEKDKRETRYLPEEFFIKNTIFIYDDVVTLITNEKYPCCVMVISREIADTMLTLFDFMWHTADKN